jgi:hypothetical protein
MKGEPFQAFVSRALVVDWPVWLKPTVAFSQVGNFHI